MSELSPERQPVKKRFAKFLFSRKYPVGSDTSICPTHAREDSPSRDDEQRITGNLPDLPTSRMQDELIMPQIEDYDPAIIEAAVDRVFDVVDSDKAHVRAKKMAARALTRSSESHERKMDAAERRIQRGKTKL